jgi:hypothetical protein
VCGGNAGAGTLGGRDLHEMWAGRHVAGGEHVRHRRAFIVVDHDAPFLGDVASETGREVAVLDVADRAEQHVAGDDGAVGETDCLEAVASACEGGGRAGHDVDT